ncbi:hypothetical protein GGTG_11187 [Gaeumannomyces tritici R3-111a-1]|uniref:Uncharacterized protein n=1 Tax=Gaeumannomyces tritici (strain R3-111a-1) TaxID=644352 RepID=J3PCG5_GAET3|nr:hypothetical protein GGTG_11187 [Gaeumannomyces tritici R3-111a-1]EJT71935.1 hypothetical protein GGTG_11187 [Gaeumannomyces tritici R3-111a-1]
MEKSSQMECRKKSVDVIGPIVEPTGTERVGQIPANRSSPAEPHIYQQGCVEGKVNEYPVSQEEAAMYSKISTPCYVWLDHAGDPEGRFVSGLGSPKMAGSLPELPRVLGTP